MAWPSKLNPQTVSQYTVTEAYNGATTVIAQGGTTFGSVVVSVTLQGDGTHSACASSIPPADALELSALLRSISLAIRASLRASASF